MSELGEDKMLAELEPQARELFAQLRRLDSSYLIMRFLWRHINTLMTLEDIAYEIGKREDIVAHTLEELSNLGLARKVDAAGVRFFGVTSDPELRQAMRDLWRWHDRWDQRLAELERMLKGQAD